MGVAFRYLKVIAAFIFAEENGLLQKHCNHVRFAKSKVKRELYDGMKQGHIGKFLMIKDEYNWIKGLRTNGNFRPLAPQDE